jgi:hypothetical protein
MDGISCMYQHGMHIRQSAAVVLGSSLNMIILEGNPLHKPTLWKSFQGIEAESINTNGFAIVAKAEMYWGICTYEIAFGTGVKHFVWATIALPRADLTRLFTAGMWMAKQEL